MMKKPILFLLLAFVVQALSAQEKTVTGTVTAAVDGEPLPGVSILAKGTLNGTQSDFDGNFSITVDETATLVFSSIGFKTSEIAVAGQTTIDVAMDEDVAQLDEVVLVGYGSLARKAITSSVASVNAEDFNKGNINSPQQLLQGKVSGLNISRPGGDPNGEFSIRLRGISTLGANTTPLVVIDGLVGGSLQSVDPNDIASIDVLKDGGAAAIYGTRGSSGVILITTKKGKANFSELNYSGYVSVESQARRTEVADAAQFSSLPNVTTSNILGSDTDWLEEISQTAIGHVHGLSASGGNDKATYRASLNYRDMEGVQKNTGFEQINARISAEQRAINDRLRINVVVSATKREEDRGFDDAFRYATIYNPTAPILDTDGTFFETGGFDTFNPVSIIENNSNTRDRENLTTGLKLDFELIKGLTIGGYYGLQVDNSLISEKYGKNGLWRGQARNGLVRRDTQKDFSQQTDFTLNYSTDINEFNIDILAGTSYQQFEAEGTRIAAGDFVSDAILDNLALSGDVSNGLASLASFKRKSKLFAYFSRLNLSYSDTYFLSAAIRPEAHDRFGSNNRWGTFGSVSAGVNLTNAFEDKLGPFDYLKIRGSWGLTGNIPALDLIAPAQATVGASGNAFNNGTFVTAYAPASNPNPDLKWEEKTEWNFGLDFALFDSKLSGSMDYYIRTTSDLLRNQSVPVPPNLFETTLLNVGEIQNSGLEFAVEYKANFGEDFSWTPGLNLATFKNRLKALDRDEQQRIGSLGSPGLGAATPILVEPGRRLGDIYVPLFNGINADGTWNVSTDVNEFMVVGNGLPDFSLNFINTFNYKNWDLNFLLRGMFGHSLVNATRAFYEQPNVAPTYNVLASSDRPELQGLTVNESRLSSLYVEKADYVTLDNITLGYNLPGLSEDNAIKSFRLYVSGQNLFTITGYEGVDPEVRYSDLGQVDNGQFFEFGRTPDALAPGIDRRATWFTTRTFTIGLNVGF